MVKQLLLDCTLLALLALAIVKSCHFTPECPKEGNASLPIPCEGYCNKYVTCVEGTWVIRMCTWPLMNFDPQTRECLNRSMVDCNWWQLSTDEPKMLPQVDMLHCPPHTSATSPSFFKCVPPDTPCESGDQKLLANPCLCQGYGSCVNGTREWHLCTVGNNFDIATGSCLPSSMVHCGDRNTSTAGPSTAGPSTTSPSTTSPSTTSPSTAGPSTISPSTTSPITTFSTTPAPNKSVVHSPTTTTASHGLFPGCDFNPVCPTQGHELMAIPCRSYCAHFIECLDGIMYIRSCIPLFYFDRFSLSCSLLADCE